MHARTCCWSRTMRRWPNCSNIISSARISTSPPPPTARRRCCWRARHAPDIVLLDWMVEGAVGDRGLPPPAPHARDRQRADHHADRARRGGGPRPRAGDRRRRLRDQAVLPARTGRARRRGAAPRAAGAGGRGAGYADHRNGYRRPQGARAAARRCALGPTEFRLLRHFLEHPGRVFSRERLLDAVWGTTATSRCAPSTSISAGCARRSTWRRRPTSSAPSARPDMRWTRYNTKLR